MALRRLFRPCPDERLRLRPWLNGSASAWGTIPLPQAPGSIFWLAQADAPVPCQGAGLPALRLQRTGAFSPNRCYGCGPAVCRCPHGLIEEQGGRFPLGLRGLGGPLLGPPPTERVGRFSTPRFGRGEEVGLRLSALCCRWSDFRGLSLRRPGCELWPRRPCRLRRSRFQLAEELGGGLPGGWRAGGLRPALAARWAGHERGLSARARPTLSFLRTARGSVANRILVSSRPLSCAGGNQCLPTLLVVPARQAGFPPCGQEPGRHGVAFGRCGLGVAAAFDPSRTEQEGQRRLLMIRAALAPGTLDAGNSGVWCSLAACSSRKLRTAGYSFARTALRVNS